MAQPLSPAAAGSGGGGSSRLLHRHASGALSSYFKDPELLPFELNMLEVALGEVGVWGGAVGVVAVSVGLGWVLSCRPRPETSIPHLSLTPIPRNRSPVTMRSRRRRSRRWPTPRWTR
jgi:hypothetical protein